MKELTIKHVVIIGGGFGGLYAAKALRFASVKVTIIDKRNFHLFQPLLYQVATGGLSPGDIASPIRAVLKRSKNTEVVQAEVLDIDPVKRDVILKDSKIKYDILILATGVHHHYFGNQKWIEVAPGLKTVENALEIRSRIFSAYEAAEQEKDTTKRSNLMTFVIVGGGPTGVELAGALGELAQKTLKKDFRHINSATSKILLLEGTERILPAYPPELSDKASSSLQKLGITVRTRTLLTDIQGDKLTLKSGDKTSVINAGTVIWAAGIKASPLGQILSKKTQANLDREGRVIVQPDLTIEGYQNIFVIGDLARFNHQSNRPLPGVAPVAIQQGRYVGKIIWTFGL